MMVGPGGDAGGGPARHVPVLLNEMLDLVAPKEGETIIDGTFGAGGYTRALLDKGASVIAIDRDPDAIAAGRALESGVGGRFSLIEGPFSRLDVLAGKPVDGVVLDIGVSSMQLDEAERGFSFRQEGPLDMRMAKAGLSAADVLDRLKAADLARVFGLLGEERHAGRIARMIEKRRSEKPFLTTTDLAQAIENLVGKNPKEKIHPATRVFQALRIFVNDELGELGRALLAAERVLKPGGRLAVVTFHSLEDRMVKRFIADRSQSHAGSRHLPAMPVAIPTFEASGKAVAAGETEVERNPRARSARMRGARRTGEPPRPEDLSVFGLPELNVKVER